MTCELIVADIGGTHARFALAQIDGGKIVSLDQVVKMSTIEHASLQTAWEAYGAELDRDLPREGAIAVAGPVGGDVLTFTNNSWMLRPALVSERLNLDRFLLVNDFGAVAHAVAHLDTGNLAHICGPDAGLAKTGVITVIGPGTGLGVAQLLRDDRGYTVIETEGGHQEFAPLDAIEDRILNHLRPSLKRVSSERVVSGPGLKIIHHVLAEIEGQQVKEVDDKALWARALEGSDALASAALDRFCMCLGTVAGDIALVQGAGNVVLAGGLGARIGDRLATSGLRERFISKGRFQNMMEDIGVYRMTHPEPGLLGAAAAFAKEYET